MKSSIKKAYQEEIRRLRSYSSSLETKLWEIYDSKAWKFIMLVRTYILRHNHKKSEVEKKKNYTKHKNYLKHPPLVSIIIPCYNQGKYLLDAVESAKEQTYPNKEIVVVNDGSTDVYTVEVFKQLKGVKIINQKNSGLSRARNTGITKARGKYICCLDSDDKILPPYIETCVTRMEEKNIDICGTYLKTFGDIYAQVKVRSLKPKLTLVSHLNSYIAGSVFKKSIWKKVGGYKEEIKPTYEDWEFWISLMEKGGIGENIPEYLFLYRRHGTTLTNYCDIKENHLKLFNLIKSFHRKLYK